MCGRWPFWLGVALVGSLAGIAGLRADQQGSGAPGERAEAGDGFAPGDVPLLGACCYDDGACRLTLLDDCALLSGDANCDGRVDFDDVYPFVQVLTHGQYLDCLPGNCDTNADGTVDFGDINPFIAILSKPRWAHARWVEGGECGACPCLLVCPLNASPEDESCGADCNGGCDGLSPEFGDIHCGETIWGRAWSEEGGRDTDWYRISGLAGGNRYRIVAEAEFDLELSFVWGDCTSPHSKHVQVSACTEAVLEVGCVPDLSYYVRISPQSSSVFQGCAYYRLALTCEACPPLLGACSVDGACINDLTEGECDLRGGDWQGPGVDCVDPGPPEVILDPASAGTFARGSIAYLTDAAGPVQYAADARRIVRASICSRAQCAVRGGEGGAGVDVVPLCHNGRCVFGRNANPGMNGIYKSPDGLTWTLVDNTWGAGGEQLWAMTVGRLIRARIAGNTRALSYSDDDGATWSSPVLTFSTPNATVTALSFTELPGGVCLVTEYASGPHRGRRVYRSADGGLTWSQVLDLHEIDPTDTTYRHWHAVGYHAATNTVVAAHGDSGEGQRFFVSTDRGLNWSVLIDSGANPSTLARDLDEQPIAFLDVGDPQWLLCASDRMLGLLWLNVDPASGDYGTIRVVPHGVSLNDGLWDGGTTQCWALFEHDGVIYACWRIPTPANARLVLTVSGDRGATWTHACTVCFDGTEEAVSRYAGCAGGFLHLILEGATCRHLVLRPLTVTMVNGLLLEPAASNLLSAADSRCESAAADVWSISSPLCGGVPLAGGHGDNGRFVRVTLDNPEPRLFYHRLNSGLGGGLNVDYAVGEILHWSQWKRGKSYNSRCRWVSPSGAGLPPNGTNEGLRTNYWFEQHPAPLTVSGTTWMSNGSHETIREGCATVDIDTIMWTKDLPSTWQVGGTPRAAESYIRDLATDADWTYIGFFALPFAAYDLAKDSGTLELLTLGFPSNTTEGLVVYYDRATLKLGAQLYAAGQALANPVLQSVTLMHERNQFFAVVIRHDGELGGYGNLELSFLMDGDWEHLATLCDDHDAYRGALQLRAGNLAGGNLLPQIVLREVLWPGTRLSRVGLDHLDFSSFVVPGSN